METKVGETVEEAMTARSGVGANKKVVKKHISASNTFSSRTTDATAS